MDSGSASRAEHRLACMKRIGAARLNVERKALLADLVDAYLPLTPGQEEEYKIIEGGSSRVDDVVGTFAS